MAEVRADPAMKLERSSRRQLADAEATPPPSMAATGGATDLPVEGMLGDEPASAAQETRRMSGRARGCPGRQTATCWPWISAGVGGDDPVCEGQRCGHLRPWCVTAPC